MRVGLVALLLVLVGCSTPADEATQPSPSPTGPSSGPSGSPTPSSPTSSPSTSPSKSPSISPTASPTPRTGTRIQAHASPFGRILFDTSGQAIYVFDQESGTRPRCYGVCADAWPPVLTRGEPRAVRGVDQSLLGTTRRKDGSLQVTYAGHPLYFYAHEGSYEVKCHDVFENGGRWYALQPDGRRAP